MAAFQYILLLIILNGIILPGLALSSSPSDIESPPGAHPHHVTRQKQKEFPRKQENEFIDRLLQQSREVATASAGPPVLDGESGDGEIRETETERVKKNWQNANPCGK